MGKSSVIVWNSLTACQIQIYFLDIACLIRTPGYKEVAIIERNSQFLPGAMVSNAQNRAPIVEHMIMTITQPLRKHRGLEAFRDQVIDIENQLRNGLLQDPRDVEVLLLLSGKVSTQ